MDNSSSLLGNARRLKFPEPIETLFRHDYYQNSLNISRAALAASLSLWMAFGLLDPHVMPLSFKTVWFIRFGLAAPFYFGVFILSFLPIFPKLMQLAISVGIVVVGFALIAITTIAQPSELGFLSYPAGLVLGPMVAYSFLRLRFWAATISNLLIVVAYLLAALFYQKILNFPHGTAIFVNNCFFIFSANIAGMATCYYLELSARRAFLANYLLDLERANEQRKREKTEGMLQILGQAIGAIVHDLGNPLTSIQSGAEVLTMFLESENADRESLKEFVEIITDGAQMMNYLRLSLIEQSRVLEGKPIPVALSPVSIRQILDASARYQNPKYLRDSPLSLQGDDIKIFADKHKMIAVFMNLIGNAFKYSDREVRVTWRVHHDFLLVCVLDKGIAAHGISRTQADQLFVAFTRLDVHAKFDGTGLGLLSARKIAEAHGGEVFIEGHENGTPDSPHFSTARGKYPSLLTDDFLTALVVTCPLNAPNSTI